jgi:hypothetical protein
MPAAPQAPGAARYAEGLTAADRDGTRIDAELLSSESLDPCKANDEPPPPTATSVISPYSRRQARAAVGGRGHGIRTQAEFRSSKFPPYEDEEEQLNPGVWGRRLAEYLGDSLTSNGIRVEPIIAEDWGWYIPLELDGVRLAVCCGHQDGDAEEFVLFTDPSRPTVRRGFRKVDVTPQLTALTDALAEILTADPDIHDVVWVDV